VAAERHAAIVMLDIRGFTRFSTTVPPKQVVDLLTSFHARIVPIVQGHGGVIDKFLGDGVMTTFGALRPSETAVADALRALDLVMAEAALWTEKLQATGLAHPLNVNGAVVAGPVVFATLGSAERLEYTVIGEAVNLAAKLEKHNKVAATRALTDRATWETALAQGYRPVAPPRMLPQSPVAGAVELLDLVVLA
jgi:adenylate cyclase